MQPVRENMLRIRERMRLAAARAGRDPASTRLIAVTKYFDDECVAALIDAGCEDLAESRPQRLIERAGRFPHVRWHLVGHLQTNKVAKVLPHVALLHSLDRMDLATHLQTQCAKQDRTIHALLQVHISEEPSKQGFAATDVASAIAEMARFPRIFIRGLMGMASLDGGPARNRLEFRRLRELAETCRAVCSSNVELTELSMGMTDDFEIAIEEGSTMVRIGSALGADERSAH